MNPFLEGLKTLGPSRLAALAVVTVGMLGLIGLLVTRGGGSEHIALLYADLVPRDAGQIAERLEAQHIPHQANADGTQIMVPTDQVAGARLLLAKDALPSGGSIGYEIFDRGDGFTANQFQENINQLRALEGELARTIRTINGVRDARVNLVLPKREPFSRDRQEAQASVLLTTVGVGRMDRETVQAVVTLVAAAVPGLRPQNVAIVDSHGNLLAKAGDLSGPTVAAQTTEELRRGMEARLSHAVEAMLEPSLGTGHVRAEASVEADFDKFNESKESYDPDGQVVRSTQTTSDASKTTEASPTVSVQNNLPNADAGAAAASGTQDQKQEETTNYEINKTVRTIAREQAQIHRISVAVVVDGIERQHAPDGTRHLAAAAAGRARPHQPVGEIDDRLRREARRPGGGREHAVRDPRGSRAGGAGRDAGRRAGACRHHAPGADRAGRAGRDRGAAADRAADGGADHHRIGGHARHRRRRRRPRARRVGGRDGPDRPRRRAVAERPRPVNARRLPGPIC